MPRWWNGRHNIFFTYGSTFSKGYKEYKCERCGNTKWEGEPIPLELHHINGNHRDNRLENLQMLCPNCHALTDNYCSKNAKNGIKHTERIVKENLDYKNG